VRRSADTCARELLASVPSIMRFIRGQMRENRQTPLSMNQFRTLAFLSCNDGASLSAISAHLDLSLPATSRMVEVLVKRRLLGRRASSNDRRRVSLSLTRRGQRTLQSARQATQAAVAQRFGTLSAPELSLLAQAVGTLGQVFARERRNTEVGS
jgi:DNA-binding MarR family transcriptional regulator